MSEILLSETVNNTLCLNLNRPQQKNALSYELLNHLDKALNDATTEHYHAIIISSSSSCFSAGADLTDLTGTIDDIEIDISISKVGDAIRDSKIPVIANIEGACVGAAVDIALACHYRVGTAQAWFQIPATRLGLLYNPDAIERMSQHFPQPVLQRLLAEGERFNALAAYDAGLLTQLPGHDEIVEQSSAKESAKSVNVEFAVSSTNALLDDLYKGQYDAKHWQQVRKDILSSPDRLDTITRAKQNI